MSSSLTLQSDSDSLQLQHLQIHHLGNGEQHPSFHPGPTEKVKLNVKLY